MRQPLGEAEEHGLALNFGGLAASGTSTCSMCTPWSSLSRSEELPGRISRVAGGSRVLQPWPNISSHCTRPPVPENKGGPVRVPLVTSAPEHVGSTTWHKGASVRAHLHMGQRGGQLIPGWLCHWLGHLARDISHGPHYPWERGVLQRGACVGNGEGDKDGGTNCATTMRMVAQTEGLQRSLPCSETRGKEGIFRA